jgi:ABC-2 type transport system permease protein
MSIYFQIIKFNLLRFLAYPLEIFSLFLRKFLETGFLILFWSVVSQSNHDEKFQLINLIAYFLIATGLGEITMIQTLRYSRTIQKAVKEGYLSNYLIKPLNSIPYLYAETVGSIGVGIIIAIVSVIVGIFLTKSVSALSLVFFFISLIIALILSFFFNLFIGIISFYATEIQGIRMLLRHVGRLLSGIVIPLSFFPSAIKNIIILTPFPSMIFAPINALQAKNFNEILTPIIVGIVWIIILSIMAKLAWDRAMRTYEAVGI